METGREVAISYTISEDVAGFDWSHLWAVRLLPFAAATFDMGSNQ
jgi:hypothetical protein